MTTTQLYQMIEEEMYEKHKEKPRVDYDVFLSNWFVTNCIDTVSDYPLEKLRFIRLWCWIKPIHNHNYTKPKKFIKF